MMPRPLDHRPVRHSLIAVVFAVVLTCLAPAGPATGVQTGAGNDIDHSRAAQVEAAYLTHLIEFADWPEDAFKDKESPLVVTIVGDDPYGVGDILEAANRKLHIEVQNRSLEVRRKGVTGFTEDDLEGVQVLFVTKDASKDLASTMAAERRRPILTIGESHESTHCACMVAFVIDENLSGKRGAFVRMRVDLPSVRAAGLRLSFKLLGMTNLVQLVEEGVSP